jgi:hypothetical protein
MKARETQQNNAGNDVRNTGNHFPRNLYLPQLLSASVDSVGFNNV